MRAFVGVGSNLGDRWRHLALAARALRASGTTAIVRASRVWDNAPMGPPQPRFLNAVLELETRLVPRDLLALLREAEATAHRRRDGGRWGARTLDLDLLLFEDRVLRERGLTLPHPGISSRRFVLAPLAELAPTLVIPGASLSVTQLVERAPAWEMVPIGLYPL